MIMSNNVQITLPNSKCIYSFLLLNIEQQIKVIEMGISAVELIEKRRVRESNIELNDQVTKMEAKYELAIHKLKDNIKLKNEECTKLKQSFANKEKNLYDNITNSIELQFKQKINAKKEEIEKLQGENKGYCLDLKNSSEKHYNEERGRTEKIHKTYQNEINVLRTNYEEKMQDIMNKICKTEENSSIKGKNSENAMLQNLNILFPKNVIEDTHKEPGKGDFIMTDMEDVKILLENKDYKLSVPKKEIDKFERDIIINPDIVAGIFMSNKSGISKKNDFQIDIIQNKPVCYLHYTDKNIDKIKIAYDVIKAVINSGIDLSNKETIDNLNKLSSEIKKKMTKCRTLIEKFSKNMLETILDIENINKKLFTEIKIKY